MTGLVSPTSGLPLRPDGPHALTDGRERWPVVDAIPYLRIGRGALASRALAALDEGDRENALVLLLADQDDWWDGPAPSDTDLRDLVRRGGELTLREAMARLAFGRVGDYFAHRWSDPTFVAGMALIDGHWTAPTRAFELACGIGHYLRELAGRGVAVAGADVVFSKLWLARHWVVPSASLTCFDAAAPWPVRDRDFDLVLCQDAFYFLEPKAHVLAGLRGLLREGGALTVAHIHNSEASNLSGGSGMDAGAIAAAFPAATIYDDADLARSAARGMPATPLDVDDMRHVEAFSLHEGCREGCSPRPPDRQGRWSLNPLYRASADGYDIAWPSERYREEYAALSTYRHRIDGEARADADAIRRREFLDLPERW